MNNDINFTYDLNTEVYGSCAATLDGEMFVLGGYNKKRQVNTQLYKKWEKSEQSDGLIMRLSWDSHDIKTLYNEPF